MKIITVTIVLSMIALVWMRTAGSCPSKQCLDLDLDADIMDPCTTTLSRTIRILTSCGWWAYRSYCYKTARAYYQGSSCCDGFVLCGGRCFKEGCGGADGSDKQEACTEHVTTSSTIQTTCGQYTCYRAIFRRTVNYECCPGYTLGGNHTCNLN